MWHRYVAMGDSFTEGLDDAYPDGSMYRGWADLVATELARRVPDFGYANLAVRGKLFDPNSYPFLEGGQLARRSGASRSYRARRISR